MRQSTHEIPMDGPDRQPEGAKDGQERHPPSIDIGDLQENPPTGSLTTHSRRDENVLQIWTQSAVADLAAPGSEILPRPLR